MSLQPDIRLVAPCAIMLLSILACATPNTPQPQKKQAALQHTSTTSTKTASTRSGCPKRTSDFACEVFQRVNKVRAAAGVPKLRYNATLERAAQLHAEDMVRQKYFSHRSLDGRRFFKRVQNAGYAGFATSENIAAGQRSPESVMRSWMNSPGHKRNILSKGGKEIGIGFHKNRWVQVFGVPKTRR